MNEKKRYDEWKLEVSFRFKVFSPRVRDNSGRGSFNIGGCLAAKQTRDKRGSRRISWQAWRQRDSRHVRLTYDNVSASATRDFKIRLASAWERVVSRVLTGLPRSRKRTTRSRVIRKLNDNVRHESRRRMQIKGGRVIIFSECQWIERSRELREIFRNFVTVFLLTRSRRNRTCIFVCYINL